MNIKSAKQLVEEANKVIKNVTFGGSRRTKKW